MIFKWKTTLSDNYQWTDKGKLYNVKTGREIKKTVNGYSVGYWICGKFITLTKLKSTLVKVTDIHCPF